VISRLTWQKGMDVLLEVLDHLVGIGGRLALLGIRRQAALENAGFHAAAARHPGASACASAMTRRCRTGCRRAAMRSSCRRRFEPCGLTQLYGLAYGCVPVVARTGGLADTVIDANLAALRPGSPPASSSTG
jgi:starch synthase